ncbi:hypothetical protein [Tepidicaulis sp.]|uniref:hypothetical protein n=1 Tax=Tepidicaulis sp. TaxID=1920809 RepID=UPI003B5ADABB
MVPFCHDRLRLAVRVRELGLEEDALAHLQVLARCAQLSDCLCREVCLEHVEKMRVAGVKTARAAANGQPVPFCKRLHS